MELRRQYPITSQLRLRSIIDCMTRHHNCVTLASQPCVVVSWSNLYPTLYCATVDDLLLLDPDQVVPDQIKCRTDGMTFSQWHGSKWVWLSTVVQRQIRAIGHVTLDQWMKFVHWFSYCRCFGVFYSIYYRWLSFRLKQSRLCPKKQGKWLRLITQRQM